MRLVELGSLAVHQDRLVRAARPLLGELHRASGLVVHLAVLDGPDVVYLEKVGDRLASAIPTRVGGRQPAHCTAVGKAMLAFCDDDSRVDLQARKTRYSISGSSQLATELTKVRAHGVAFEREESQLGFGCVAAPIGSPGEAVAAVSVCGPMNRMMFDQRLTAPDPDDCDGHLAQCRGRPTAGCADLATAASVAAAASLSRITTGTAVRVSLDPQIAPLLKALNRGFPPVHTMTGAQARATIRSRFVPPREPEPVAEIRRHDRPRTCRRYTGKDLPARTRRSPADTGVRARRRLRVLRPGQPRRLMPRYRQSHSSRCCFGGLPSGSRAPVARGGRGRLRRDPVGSG